MKVGEMDSFAASAPVHDDGGQRHRHIVLRRSKHRLGHPISWTYRWNETERHSDKSV